MTDASQHANTRREWWIIPEVPPKPITFGVAYREPSSRPQIDRWEIHVREVLPGEITITREELHKAWQVVSARPPSHQTGKNSALAVLERTLFGQLPEGSQVPE